MNDKKSLIISIMVTVIIVAIITSLIDPSKLIDRLSKTDLLFLSLAILCYLSLNILITLRIKALLEEMGQNVSFFDCLFSHYGGMLASDFTPARSGYFLTAFLLSSQDQGKIEKTLTAIFAPQLLEFLLKVVCTGILTIFLIGRLSGIGSWSLYIMVAIIAIALIVISFLALLFVHGLLEKFSFLKSLPGGKKIYYLFHLMRDNSIHVKNRWKEVLVFTISSWLLKGFEWYFIAQSLGIHIFGSYYDYLFMLLFQTFLTLTHFLPLPTLAGAGAAEAVGSGVLGLFGVSLESALAFLFITRTLMIVVDLMCLKAIVPLFRKESLTQIIEDINNIEGRLKS